MATTTSPPQVAPARNPALAPRPRVRVTTLSAEHAMHLVTAALGALGLAWVVYERILPVSGGIGFWVSSYVAFLGLYVVVSATALDRVAVVDWLVGALVTTAGTIMVACLAGIIGFVVVRGWTALHHWNFFTQTTAYIGPEAALNKG